MASSSKEEAPDAIAHSIDAILRAELSRLPAAYCGYADSEDRLEKLLIAFCEGRLADDDRDSFLEHAACCSFCGERLNAMMRLTDSLEAIRPRHQPAADASAPVFDEPSRRPAARGRAWMVLRNLCTGLTATAAMVVIAWGVSMAVMSKRLEQHVAPVQTEQMDWRARSASREQALALAMPAGWRRAMLAVGVSRYRSGHKSEGGGATQLDDLPAAAVEAERVSGAAVEYMGVARENAICLVDDRASEASVRASLIFLRQFHRKDDMLILHFACHAVPDQRGGIRLLMYDSPLDGGIWSGEILGLLGDGEARIVLVADVCYAGTLAEQLRPNDRCWSVASALPSQLAFESPLLKESWFGRGWIEAINTASADVNGDNVTMLREAFDWAQRRMILGTVDQRAMLLVPMDGDDLVLAAHPDLWRAQPAADPPDSVKATVRLVPSWTGKVPCDLLLDGTWLGKSKGNPLLLPVSAGEHELVVRADPRLAGTNTAAESRCTFSADPVVPTDVPISLGAGGVARVLVIGPEDRTLFPQLLKAGLADAIEVTWDDDQVLKLSFAAVAGVTTLSAQYIADPTEGVDIAGILGLPDDGTAEFTCDARGSTGADVVTFFIGGVGLDSLQPRVSRVVTLPADNWVRVSIPLPASKLHRLVNGMGIEVTSKDDRGGVVELHVRDAAIVPRASIKE